MIEKEFTFSHLFLYIIIAYGFSWLFWLPEVLLVNHLPSFPEFFAWIMGFIAPWGPFVAAFVLTYKVKGKEGMKGLLKRSTNLNFSKKWFFPTIFIFPLWAGTAFLIGIFTTTVLINLPWFSNPLWLLFNMEYTNFLYLLVFTGIAEEFGWRGFTLDILQKKFNASISTILLGLIWACWHIPIFFMEAAEFQITNFGFFLVQVIFYSFLYTWIYNNTRRSILTAILLHTMEDFTLFALFPVTQTFGADSLAGISMYVLGGIILVIILVVWSPQTLATRKGINAPDIQK